MDLNNKTILEIFVDLNKLFKDRYSLKYDGLYKWDMFEDSEGILELKEYKICDIDYKQILFEKQSESTRNILLNEFK